MHNGTWSRNSSDGDGHVEPGRTWCATPAIDGAGTALPFKASGRDCVGTYPDCTTNGHGETARTR